MSTIVRIAFAALAAGLIWLAKCALRAVNGCVAIAERKGFAAPFAMDAADLCLVVGKALCTAGEWADQVARPARRA